MWLKKIYKMKDLRIINKNNFYLIMSPKQILKKNLKKLNQKRKIIQKVHFNSKTMIKYLIAKMSIKMIQRKNNKIFKHKFLIWKINNKTLMMIYKTTMNKKLLNN